MDLYHVLNRGVEKRDIFLDDRDHARFVHDMYEFNDTAPAGNAYRAFNPAMMDFRNPSSPRIVDIHAWCLMKNHYHLLLSERVEGGMSYFMRKLNVGYANYFNTRYERSGTLFQGKTKKILIGTDAHYMHIVHYIHFNPLDFSHPDHDWRESGISSIRKAREYLKNYKWSSFNDYCGRRAFPSILTMSEFGGPSDVFERKALRYLQDLGPNSPGKFGYALE